MRSWLASYPRLLGAPSMGRDGLDQTREEHLGRRGAVWPLDRGQGWGAPAPSSGRHRSPGELLTGIRPNDRMSLFIAPRWGRGTPEQSRPRRSFRQPQFLLRDGVLFQCRAIGGVDRGLGRQDAGGRAACDPPRADELGNNGIATAYFVALPAIRAARAAAVAAGQRKSGDHVTSATMIRRREQPSWSPKRQAAETIRPNVVLAFGRPRLAAERVTAAFVEESAVRRNSEVLAQYPSPSAPPYLANRHDEFRGCRRLRRQSSGVIINLSHDLVNH